MKLSGSRVFVCLSMLAAGLLTVDAIPSSGAENPLPLTLSEAIATAVKHNPQVQAARHQVAAAMSRTTQVRSGLLPQIDVSEAYNHTNSPLWAFGTKLNQGAITAQDFSPDRLNDPDAINNFKTALSLTWRLFDGGGTWIGWRQAQQNQEAGKLALLRNEQSVIAQTAETYVGCLLAEENHIVVAQALETARAHLKVVEDRQRSGLAVKSDVLRAQVRIADLEQQRLQADSRIQVALARLGAVMGKPDVIGDRLILVSAFERCVPTRGDLETWIKQALDQRPDLKQIQIQEKIAGMQVARARTGHYPTLALQGNYEINSEDFSESKDNYTVGAVVQLNLYSGQRISAQSAEARAMLAKIRSMRQALALGVRVEIQKAFYEAQSSWQSIAVAQTAVDQAQEGLRIVANRYQNGLLALISLLDAQVALQQAQTQHFKALHDYKVSRISLALASGNIDKDFE